MRRIMVDYQTLLGMLCDSNVA
ncbi:conserved protein of unknown function [Ectopseudomonas oleovorans]|uniref:Uncharacterized protein n=1 Tax=Ectopseudomonas oleovorans TaxID=301 RepID=A0A653AYP5_ECTOL|nr:conserved protein of unknown function [Pseudomonas oleovorans]